MFLLRFLIVTLSGRVRQVAILGSNDVSTRPTDHSVNIVRSYLLSESSGRRTNTPSPKIFPIK